MLLYGVLVPHATANYPARASVFLETRDASAILWNGTKLSQIGTSFRTTTSGNHMEPVPSAYVHALGDSTIFIQTI
jgi:hypothetical protein